jgi:hypothetical protein
MKIKLPKYIEDMHEDKIKFDIFPKGKGWRICYSSHEAFLWVDGKTKKEVCDMALKKIKDWEWNAIGSEEVEVEI